ncbi:hypothetical protein V7S79_10855 [Aquirufa sp. ROCK-SH2]
MLKKFTFLLLVIVLFISIDSFGQCAMCRTTIESSISNGRSNIATGLNTGILYLLSAPYLLVAGIAFLWFKQSKKEQEEKLFKLKIKSRVANLFGQKL